MAALLATLGTWLIGAIKWILRILLLVAFIALIYPLLPDDPFRSIILSFRTSMQPFSVLINWMLPVDYIVSSSFFWVACKLFFIVYKMIANSIGLSFTSSVSNGATSEDV